VLACTWLADLATGPYPIWASLTVTMHHMETGNSHMNYTELLGTASNAAVAAQILMQN